MLKYSGREEACFEHPSLFKVNAPEPFPRSVKGGGRLDWDRGKGRPDQYTPSRQTGPGHAPSSDYELFNCNNFNIRYWSWNYRGCWHQTCPPIVPR